MEPRISFVGAGSGDPDLVTVRARATIEKAEVVLYDPTTLAVLSACLAGDRRIECSAITPETSIPALLAQAAKGTRVVRLVEGDPTLFGAIAIEAAALMAAGHAFDVVPGIPLFVAAASRAGITLGEGAVVLTREGILRFDSRSETRKAIDHELRATAIVWPPQRDGRSIAGTFRHLLERGLDDGAHVIVVGREPTLPWLEARPLFGRTVLVTRAREQASETARALRARGAIPIEMPTIVIGPPDDIEALHQAARDLAHYSVVVLTSANGVDALFASIAHVGLDTRALGSARLAAIGPGTAKALARYGVIADLVPSEHRGEALAAEILRTLAASRVPAQGLRMLLPRATVARDALPEALRAAGVIVDVVPAYRTRSPDEDDVTRLRNALKKRAIDAIVFTASSTVEHLCALVDDAPSALRGVTVATIGPITSDTCRRLGLHVDVEASPYTIAALIDALETHLGS